MLAAGLLFRPRLTTIVLVAAATFVYTTSLVYRVLLFRRGFDRPSAIAISDEEARAIPDDELPVYTVLIPAYREPEVIGDLIAALERIEYPRNRLDVKILLEEDDAETIAAVSALPLGAHMQLVYVPPAEPRTKPKALNYGLAAAIGEYVTVYDAEDRPDPLQLRRAVAVMQRAPKTLACLQARLDSFNPRQNIMTEWFSLEYTIWFRQFLPGLVSGGEPVPLGGTSNHFRRDVLVRVGGWDSYNVTEDADLGVRLHRLGYRVGMFDSTTFEEANSDFVNWAKQRSRWHKGHLQTWLVHMRHPVVVWRALGPRGFVVFNLFVGGTPLMAILSPIFWFLTLLWFAAQPPLVPALFPGPILYIGLVAWLIGNFLFFYAFVLAAAEREDVNLFRAACFSPVYFVMMSVGAYKALFQLISEPSYWEKTEHGLASLQASLRAIPEEGARVR